MEYRSDKKRMVQWAFMAPYSSELVKLQICWHF
jgi:hypothetical protein